MRHLPIPQLLASLDSPDPAERQRGMLELLSGFSAALRQADRPERLALIRHLGEIGGRRAATELCSLLGAVSDEEEEAVGVALVQIGPAAVPPLCRTLGEGRPNIEDHAVRALGRIGDGSCALALVRALGDWRSHVRSAASEALLTLVERGHVREVREAMPSLQVQSGAEMAPIQKVRARLAEIEREVDTLPLPADAPGPDLASLPLASSPEPDPITSLPLPASKPEPEP